MREYKRPLLVLEEFAAEQSVADGCTRTSTTVDTKGYEPQTVTCIITGSDKVFGSTNCTGSGYDKIDSTSLVWYDKDKDNVQDEDELYFLWKNKSGTSVQPSASATSTLQAIGALAGVDTDPHSNGGYTVHAGLVSSTTISTTTYSFSY